MSLWLWASYAIFAPAFLLLSLLLFPVPKVIRKYTFAVVDKILFAKVYLGCERGSIPLLYFVLILVTSVFLITFHEAQNAEKEWHKAIVRGHRDITILLNKFRDERNVWISGFGLTLWIILWRIRALLRSEEVGKQPTDPAASATSDSAPAQQPPAVQQKSSKAAEAAATTAKPAAPGPQASAPLAEVPKSSKAAEAAATAKHAAPGPQPSAPLEEVSSSETGTTTLADESSADGALSTAIDADGLRKRLTQS